MAIKDDSSFLIADWRVFPDEDLITRADLEQAVWHGGVVGYDALTSMVIKLCRALGDNAKQPSYIATVPKRGYQLIAQVTRYEPEPSGSRPTDARRPTVASQQWRDSRGVSYHEASTR